MRLKLRTVLVILLSSVIIASVLGLTLFGFYAYLEWKEELTRRNYRTALLDLNAELFNKYIEMNLVPEIETEGVFQGTPIVGGTIKNTSNKSIYSMQLRLAFRDPERRVLYVDHFYPIGPNSDSYLASGDSLSFKYRLKNCPPEVTERLRSRLRFAKGADAGPIALIYKIEDLDIR